MAVSDKTRKVLWGRSGNRCAICRRELVIDATPADDEAVVGDECHIVSANPTGPRYDSSYPIGALDEPENLILLCRVHHKMVDDQPEMHTASILRQIKTKHETWVSATLSSQHMPHTVRVRRIKGDIPTHLVRLMNGQDVMAVVANASACSPGHDEPTSEREMELIASFLQEAQELGEMSAELEPADLVRGTYELTKLLRELDAAGFWVFGWREVRQLEGGHGPSSPFPVAILRVMRSDSPEIIRLSGTDYRSEVSPGTDSRKESQGDA